MISMGLTSVAEIYRVIKQFHFEPGLGRNAFNDLTFSDTDLICLSADTYEVKLKVDSDGKYSTDDNIWFRTWVTNPKACRKLLMLETFPEIQPDATSIGLRLYDGTDDLYWDGTDWSIAAADDWNTEAEINAHIESFPILPDRQFAVTVNLKSIDGILYSAGDVTPVIDEIRVLMEVHIDFLEDIIFRSLMPLMESGLHCVANFAAIPAFATDVNTITFTNYRMNTPFNIVDVERVYDLTDDIELLYNLFQSYNSGTGVITLSSPLPSGHRPLIVFRYAPEIMYVTHQDWVEVHKLPCVIIQRIEAPVSTAFSLSSREGIVNKSTGKAVVIDDPLRLTLQFRLHGLTASSVDEIRLMSKVMEFFKTNQMLTSIGLDEKYYMYIEKEFRDLTHPNKADQRTFWTNFAIHDLRLPFISRDTFAVKKLTVNVSEPKPAHEDPVKGGSRVITYVHSIETGIEWTRTIEIE